VKGRIMPLSKLSKRSLLLIVPMLVCGWSSAQTSARIQKLSGMWSDPPVTIIGQFCAGWCTDAGIDRLNALLDEPANDKRSVGQLQNDAHTFERDKYIRPRLTAAALRNYPLDPADDPSFLRCEPYGLARQFIARHQLEIRESGKDRLDFHYGEWDVHRTIFMDVTDGTGKITRWTVEFAGRLNLSNVGWTEQSIKSGQRVTVTGNPTHTGSDRMFFRKLVRSDGSELLPAAPQRQDTLEEERRQRALKRNQK
jgi:hypothetical protein